MENKAVILVDFQKDFIEAFDGSLAIPGTDFEYVDTINHAINKLINDKIPVITSQDWHPTNHMSFNKNGGNWPIHCVQNSFGSELCLTDEIKNKTIVFKKGMDSNFDSYSAFKDDDGKGTGLLDYLMINDITDLRIFGLATDYCVKATVLDALTNGFNVEFVKNLSMGVSKTTTYFAIEEMRSKGAKISIYTY